MRHPHPSDPDRVHFLVVFFVVRFGFCSTSGRRSSRIWNVSTVRGSNQQWEPNTAFIFAMFSSVSSLYRFGMWWNPISRVSSATTAFCPTFSDCTLSSWFRAWASFSVSCGTRPWLNYCLRLSSSTPAAPWRTWGWNGRLGRGMARPSNESGRSMEPFSDWLTEPMISLDLLW